MSGVDHLSVVQLSSNSYPQIGTNKGTRKEQIYYIRHSPEQLSLDLYALGIAAYAGAECRIHVSCGIGDVASGNDLASAGGILDASRKVTLA